MITEKIIRTLEPFLLKWHEKISFNNVIRKTAVLIFPFVLIGTLSQLVQLIFFTPNSFSILVLHLGNFTGLIGNTGMLFKLLTESTLGILGILTAYGTAKFATEMHHDNQLAGLVGAISFLILSYRFSNRQFSISWIGSTGIVVGVLVGFGVASIFKIWSKPVPSKPISFLNRVFASFLSVNLSFLIAIILTVLINLIIIETSKINPNIIATHSHIFWIFGISILRLLMTFLGLSDGGLSFLSTTSNSTNLNVALIHHSLWSIPFPLTIKSLYIAYGNFGSTGMLLALVILILRESKLHDFKIVARWSLLPIIFNLNMPLMIGLPIMFLPTFVIPYFLAPLVSMFIAALAITLHIIPAMVYPVPTGTPVFLQVFLGTGGNWLALLLGIFNLGISALIYWPFLKLDEKVLMDNHLPSGLSDEKVSRS
ncbi:PTS transporter subunit EIIC [Companilactobacillus insicii]|uniref:PTS transporter subunit EIIC n=1 Tax=Companilactobacillus insicii TaxID=1732567 RepID=UPI000F78EBC8|nr:PTS transporter subunit EIIC [Companilactobacillus insicii]